MKQQTLRDKSKWTKPKSIHTIKGVTHTFNAPCSRATAVRMTGNVRVKRPRGYDSRGLKLVPFHIRTYRKDATIMPAPLKTSLIELHQSHKHSKEFIKTILDVRMRHPRV